MSSSADTRPRRWTVLAVLAGLTSLAAWVGAGQLVLGVFTPPVDDLDGLGLESWLLPGLWLAASVAVPCLVLAVAAWRAESWTPRCAQLAAALLLVELVVQVPFVGPDPFQAVVAVVAAALALLGHQPKIDGALVTP